jgi:tetratricopeptide (TPR) repeat protein
MLNVREELSSFKSIDIETLEQKLGKIPEDMKQAIDLYNKAVEDVSNKNEDMAIIALKKAVAIYPAFYEAMLLMGVCYAAEDQEDEARAMFSKVIKMDDSSIRASRYLDELDGKIPAPDTKGKSFKARSKPQKESTVASWLKRGLGPEKKSPYYLKYVVGVVIGVLIMCLVWLAVPVDKPIVIDIKGLFSKTTDQSGQVKQLQEEVLTLNTRLDEALTALQKARETEKQLQDQMDQYVKWSAILRDLQNLADQGKYKEVVIEIEKNLAGLTLPAEIEKEIIALNNLCKPKAIKQFYDSAKKAYDGNAKAKSLEVYQQAANDYAMAIRIMEELGEEPSFRSELYYYGGKAIALSESPSKEEANQEAIRCFKAVISNFPGSKLASYAQARINEIEAGIAIKH